MHKRIGLCFTSLLSVLILFGIGLLGTNRVSLAQGDTWTRKNDVPTARGGLSGTVVGGKIYAIGGWPANMGSFLRTVEECDPATDTWASRTDMPTGRALHCACVVDGIVYVFGGDESWIKVEAYDPTTDQWTSKADMPTGRGGLSCAVVNGKIYVMGGTRAPTWTPLKTVEEYDPATDTWTAKADMHAGRYCFASSMVDGIIYVVGGEGSSNTVEAYDPTIDRWTQKAGRMSVGRTDHAACAVNGVIYVIGGLAGTSMLSRVEAYDPMIDAFAEKTSMPTPRMQSGIGAVGGRIYVIGGCQGFSIGAPACKIVEEYTTPVTLVEGEGVDNPVSFALCQNYPNPFNPSTTIAYALPHAGHATLKVYNVLGEEVATLVSGDHAAGTFKATWDASGQPSGVYFYRLTAGEYVQTKKMVLMR